LSILADHTNGRAYGTKLCLTFFCLTVVCNECFVTGGTFYQKTV